MRISWTGNEAMKGFGKVNIASMALASPQVKITTSNTLSRWWKILELIRLKHLHREVAYIFSIL